MTKKLLFVGALFIFSIILLGHPAPAQANSSIRNYQRVSSILSQVKQTEDLPNTVHKNPLVLKAVGLFLKTADADDLSDEEMHEKLRSLFPVPRWKEWVPQFEIRKVKNGLYLVSLGYAAVTQESSLYLFQGSAYILIDSGNIGLIHIEDVSSPDAQLEVTYVRTPGSTQPESVTAALSNRSGKWRVIDRRIQQVRR